MKRRLAIPRSVTVRGKRVRISQVKRPGKSNGETQRLEGYYVPDDKRMEIRRRSSRLERERTFVHEVLHACFPQRVVSDEDEERIVSKMEVPMHQLLVSGQLVAYPEEVP
jgi:hypothetical protein